MLSPIVPLILVCVCGVMEMAKPGSGNRFGRMIYLEPQQLSFKRMFPAEVWNYPIETIQNRLFRVPLHFERKYGDLLYY